MYIVTVLFTIHEVHWSAFMQAMLKNAQTSLAVEEGCHQFDVGVAEPNAYTVFLYEVYESASDFETHLKSQHFLEFNAQTSSWVADKKVQTFRRLTT
jgi:(4S)-4-hydroxy-5-phosphonooxypentane-2,3-dione isomerase